MPPRDTEDDVDEDSEDRRDQVDDVGDTVDDVMDEGGGKEEEESSGGFGISIPVIPTILCLGILIALHYHFTQKEAKLLTTHQGPRLVHVVQEYQGFRKLNLIGLAVMTLAGSGLLMTMILYRKQRVELARKHDAVFWMLSSWSLLLGVIWTIQRYRKRRQLIAQASLRNAWKRPEMYARWATYALPLIPILIFAWLLWYRRKHHLEHLKRKRERLERRRDFEARDRDYVQRVT